MTSIGLPVALVAAPLQAFVEVPLAPGSAFNTVEIQRLGGKDGDPGILVKLQRWSGELDIYFEPHLPLTEQWFDSDPSFAHLTLGSLHPTEFSPLGFTVDAHQIHVDISFTERAGQTVTVRVDHRARRPAPALFAPAPAQERPATLRLLSLEHFRMIPRRGSTVEATVDGVAMSPQPFILPGRLASHWSARAASGIVMASCNGDADGVGDVRVGDDSNWLAVRFAPEVSAGGSGTFEITSPMGRVTAGAWRLASAGNEHAVTLTAVRQDWFPGWSHPGMLALAAARKARRRNQRWRWSGHLQKEEEGWRRVGRWTVLA